MALHKIMDRVKLLRVDYPFNNSVGVVDGIRIARPGSGVEYRIDFDGPNKDPTFHREICVVAEPKGRVVMQFDNVRVRDEPGMSTFQMTMAQLGGAVVKPMVLSEDAAERKGTPITTGVLDYFPLAIAEVAKCSKAGNDQHNPGQPLHWDKTKSTDHADCMARHLIDRGSIDTDGIRHSAKLAWRALANLQIELENAKKAKQ